MVLRIKNIGTYATHLPFLTKTTFKAFSIFKAQGLLIDTERNYTMWCPLNMCETTTFQLVLMKLCLLMASLVAQTVKHLPAMQGSIPGLGRSPGEENGNPLQYSCLANSVDRGGVQFVGLQRVRNDWENNTLTWYFPTDAHRNIFNTWRKQNKITCPNISTKFPIWVLFSTASFIYEIKKLLFCTASDPIPCLYLHVGFVCMLLKE